MLLKRFYPLRHAKTIVVLCQLLLSWRNGVTARLTSRLGEHSPIWRGLKVVRAAVHSQNGLDMNQT